MPKIYRVHDIAVTRRSIENNSEDTQSDMQTSDNEHMNGTATTALLPIMQLHNNNADEALVHRILPKELLLRAFSYLDIRSLCRCAQVCRAWNTLALDGSNWQSVDLFYFQRDVKGHVVESLAKRCGGFLKKLSLSGCENIHDEALHTFAENCKCIEKLSLAKCKKITDRTPASLGIHCTKLAELNLEGCLSITNMSLKSLSDGCPYLTVLNISWCSQITDNGVSALAHGCTRLQTLQCKGIEQLTDESLCVLAAHCPQLKVVNLYKCIHVTDHGIQHLSAGCLQLMYLCLSYCNSITDRSLVSLSHCCPMLKTLELVSCTLLTDGGFAALAKNCHDLERMDLEECNQISDQTLVHLANGCPSLLTLGLSHCEQITDDGIRALAMGLCLHDTLRELALDNCPLVTDQSLDHLRECRALERIDLYDCQLITRPGIRRFKNHLPHVKVHAYFAPNTPPPVAGRPQRRYCKCCNIL